MAWEVQVTLQYPGEQMSAFMNSECKCFQAVKEGLRKIFHRTCQNPLCACPRYQLAFALLVAELLPGLTSPLEAYDPVFNDIDRAFLHKVGVKVRMSRAAHFKSLVSSDRRIIAHCLASSSLQAVTLHARHMDGSAGATKGDTACRPGCPCRY